MNMKNKDFWDRVNNFIKTSNKTQKTFSSECGFGERRIESLCSGDRLPDPLECLSIANVMGVTVDYLLTGKVSETEVLSDTEKLLISLYRKTPKPLQDVILSHTKALSDVNGKLLTPPTE